MTIDQTPDAARCAQIAERLLKSANLLDAMAQRPNAQYDQSAYRLMRDSPALAGIAPDLREAAAELSRLSEAQEASKAMVDAAEMLWVVLANASGGDWTQQSPEWQEAAARWRDNYFAALARLTAAPEAQPHESHP